MYACDASAGHREKPEGLEYVQQGLAPSQGSVAITHWSQACLDVVARVVEAPC